MSRPSKLTPEVAARIVRAVATGNTRADSAAYANVSYSTLNAWVRRGRKGRKPYVAFVAALKRAEAAAARRMVGQIRTAARKQWQAAAWWLERKFPERWGDQRRLLADLARELKEIRAACASLRPPQANADAPPAAP